MLKSDNVYNAQILLDRIKSFVVKVVHLVEKLPKTSSGFRIGGQLIDSAGSIGANYSEAQAARSKREFIAICGIILKEAKETIFWLDIIKLSKISSDESIVNELIDESEQLSRIFAKIIISSNQNK